MRFFILRNVILILALLATTIASAQDRHLHTYSMRRAVPEQVVPALEAQLSSGSSVRTFQNQLILNVTDAEYRDALSLLDQLDVAARSLVISVRKGSIDRSSDNQYGVDGRIGGNSSRLNVRAIDSSSNARRDNSPQVRAVEGMPAFIAVGASYPMTTRSSAYGASSYGSGRELVPVESGFYATARVIGDEVIVDIDQRDDHRQGRGIATQDIQTQVRGRVGEWLPLGALDSSENSDRRELIGAGSTAQSSSGDIAIRVDVSP